jgi:lipoprotein-releasing system ATP-binding protein
MNAALTPPVLQMQGINKGYTRKENGQGESLSILRDASLTLHAGEVVALVAPSGTGKSTLLHIAGLLEPADSGVMRIFGHDVTHLSEAQRTVLRAKEIGFVYQFHHLLPELSSLENVVLPQLIRGLEPREAKDRARELLAFLGLKERLTHRPSELSGGEQQRVAIARAVANAPRLLLADEPTGNLDPKTAEHVFQTLLTLARASGLAALVATHNLHLAARMDRQITLKDGAVVPYEIGALTSM